MKKSGIYYGLGAKKDDAIMINNEKPSNEENHIVIAKSGRGIGFSYKKERTKTY